MQSYCLISPQRKNNFDFELFHTKRFTDFKYGKERAGNAFATCQDRCPDLGYWYCIWFERIVLIWKCFYVGIHVCFLWGK